MRTGRASAYISVLLVLVFVHGAAATLAPRPDAWHESCLHDGRKVGDNFAVRASTISNAGMGVFAGRDIKQGELVLFASGIPMIAPNKCGRDCFAELYPHPNARKQADYVLTTEPFNATHVHTVVGDSEMCPGHLSGMINTHTYEAENNVAYAYGFVGTGRHVAISTPVRAIWDAHELGAKARADADAAIRRAEEGDVLVDVAERNRISDEIAFAYAQ